MRVFGLALAAMLVLALPTAGYGSPSGQPIPARDIVQVRGGCGWGWRPVSGHWSRWRGGWIPPHCAPDRYYGGWRPYPGWGSYYGAWQSPGEGWRGYGDWRGPY
jgi:hypothetical protein